MCSGTGQFYDIRPKCKGCGLPLDDTNWLPSFRKRGQKRCSSCNSRLAKLWREQNPHKQKEYDKKRGRHWISSRYGLTEQEWDEMFKIQEGSCAICQTKVPGGNSNTFHVDHDHKTGRIRELLCDRCNRGLGYFRDSITILKLASKYLEKHNENN